MFLETLDLKFDAELLADILCSNEYVEDNMQTMINSRSSTPTMDHIFEGASTISNERKRNGYGQKVLNWQRAVQESAAAFANTSLQEGKYGAWPKTHVEDSKNEGVVVPAYTDIEFDWKYILPCYRDTYVEEVVEQLKKYYKVGRIRTMALQGPYAYTLHSDMTKRLHIPIITNKNCYFVDGELNNYFMHEPGRVYILDTTQQHAAINLSMEDRLHIVAAVEEL